MKRVLVTAIIAFSIFSWGLANAEPISVKISMGSCPIGHPLLKAGEDLDKWIQEKSNGKYSVQLLPNGTVGNYDTVYQMTMMGSMPISLETTSNLANIYPELSAFEVPYLFKDSNSLTKFLQSKSMKDMLGEIGKKRPEVNLVGASNVSFRYLASKKPVKTLKDMEGSKNRISNNKLHSLAIKALGMAPTPTASSEILSSLQQGVVDTTDVEIFWPLTGRLYDVCKYYLELGALPVIHITAVSNAWLNKLSPEDRELWKKGVEYFLQQADIRLAEGRTKAIEELKKNGCEFFALSQADKDEATKRCVVVADKLNKKQKEFYTLIKNSNAN